MILLQWREVIYRRYRRLLDEGSSLPQLIIVDGGKGNCPALLKVSVNWVLENKISIIGIAKKLEEIYFPNDQLPLYLDKKSTSLKIIQHMRNEAHRFGITHHRKRRLKGTFTYRVVSNRWNWGKNSYSSIETIWFY